MDFGSAAHVVEPKYPVAVDRYLNLGMFYDVDAIKLRCDEVTEHVNAYRAAYENAYHCLEARGEVDAVLKKTILPYFDSKRVENKLCGIVSREFKGGKSRRGSVVRRYLGGITYDGYVWEKETLNALADNICEVTDPFNIGGELMKKLADDIVSRGFDIIEFIDSDDGESVQHIVVPACSFAFIRTGDNFRYKGERKVVHIERAVDTMHEKSSRSARRLYKKIAAELADEGVAALKRAKENHDKLEKTYNPHVDFSGVTALAYCESERWLNMK